MNIKMFKLNSGEHMIAEVVNETKDTYTLIHPCMAFPHTEGGNSVQVVPTYNLYNDDGISINKSQIVYEGIPQDEIYQQYESAFGSVILTQSSSILRG